MEDLNAYTLVHAGEMFLTYAQDEQQARTQFNESNLPESGRVRLQPRRAPDEFLYTRNGELLLATLIGVSGPDPAPEDTISNAEVEEPSKYDFG